MKEDNICIVPNCDKKVRAKGYCAMHYQRLRRYGRLERFRSLKPESCIVPNCDRKVKARGYCVMHYARWQIYGYPEGSGSKNFNLKCTRCNKPTRGGLFCKNCYDLFRVSFRYHNDEEYRQKTLERQERYRKSDKAQERIKMISRKDACKIIYHHAHDPVIQDDPEALGAEFIEDFIDVHCDRLEEEGHKIHQKRRIIK